MKPIILWPEFIGIHVAILAALAGVALGVKVRRRDFIQRLALGYAVGFQFAGVGLFLIWLLNCDPLFGHYTGPPALLFAGMAGSALGITAVLFWLVSTFGPRPVGFPRPPNTPWMSAGLLTLALPTGLVLLAGSGPCARALKHARWEHFSDLIGKGPEVLPVAIKEFQRNDPDTRSTACAILGSMGPAAKPAIPHLLNDLEARADKPGEAYPVVQALGRIGPAAKAAVPTLVRMGEQESCPPYAQGAILEALSRLGPEAEAAQRQLAARLLPGALEKLKSNNHEKVQQAGGVLHAMGAAAEPALPALKARLSEIRSNSADYAAPGWGLTKSFLEFDVKVIESAVAVHRARL